MTEMDARAGTATDTAAPRSSSLADTELVGTRAADVRSPAPNLTATAPPPRTNRRGRIRKWDRPAPPHDWRWYVGNLGKTLISIGLLMFAFVAYQLWGTGIETAAAQRELTDEFEELLAQAAPIPFEAGPNGEAIPIGQEPPPAEPGTPAPGDPATPPPAVPIESQNIPDWENGDAVARLEIPKLGVDDVVVAGVDSGDLEKGPGHFPDTPLPGQLGNSAIAGHRTTFGSPFRNVDQLEPGDEIRVTTLNGVFVYRVTGRQIVSPSDYSVVSTTDPTRATLTLTSCHPVFTARERIIIFSELDPTASGPVGEPLLNYGRPEPVPEADTDTDRDITDSSVVDDPTVSQQPNDPGTATGTLDDDEPEASELLGSDEVNSNIADAFSEGWFSDPSANPQVGLWGLALGAISFAAYMLSRKLRRDWAGLLVGIVPFTLALYFFFQNVNRLLPPNL